MSFFGGGVMMRAGGRVSPIFRATSQRPAGPGWAVDLQRPDGSDHDPAGTASLAQSHRPTATRVQGRSSWPPEAILLWNHGTRPASDRGPALRTFQSSTPSLHSPREGGGSSRRWFPKADAGGFPRFHNESASGGQELRPCTRVRGTPGRQRRSGSSVRGGLAPGLVTSSAIGDSFRCLSLLLPNRLIEPP